MISYQYISWGTQLHVTSFACFQVFQTHAMGPRQIIIYFKFFYIADIIRRCSWFSLKKKVGICFNVQMLIHNKIYRVNISQITGFTAKSNATLPNRTIIGKELFFISSIFSQLKYKFMLTAIQRNRFFRYDRSICPQGWQTGSYVQTHRPLDWHEPPQSLLNSHLPLGGHQSKLTPSPRCSRQALSKRAHRFVVWMTRWIRRTLYEG